MEISKEMSAAVVQNFYDVFRSDTKEGAYDQILAACSGEQLLPDTDCPQLFRWIKLVVYCAECFACVCLHVFAVNVMCIQVFSGHIKSRRYLCEFTARVLRALVFWTTPTSVVFA